MKKIVRSVLSLTLCLMMVLTALSPAAGIVTVSAANSGTCGDNLTWTLGGNTLTIRGEGKMTDYDSSSDVPWYSFRDSIKNVIIKDGVTSIGDYAFYYCEGLTSAEIPEGVTSIGDSAFYGCISLKSIVIPEGVTSVGGFAFKDCTGLECIEIPDSVESIGGWAFNRCTGLTSIDIGNGLLSIGYCTFDGCSALKSIKIPDSVKSIGDYAFCGCEGLTSIDIGSGVTIIGDYAFGHCGELASVTVDEDNTVYDSRNGCNAIVKTKANRLLIGCKNTTIPNSITNISYYAFYGCTGLTSIEIPDSVTSIGKYAFEDCEELTSIEIPASVTSIGEDAFRDCSKLESITVDEDNTVYDSRNDCNAIIETGTDTLLFGFKSTVIPTDVTSIGEDAFHGCMDLTDIEIPEGVTSIGAYAFCWCLGLTSINIPEGVTSIGEGAFAYCWFLADITLGNGITSIGEWAFGSCSGLTDVYYGGSKANRRKITFGTGNDFILAADWHYNSAATDDSAKEAPVAGLDEAELIMGNAQNNQMTYAYKTAVTFRANVPEGSSVQWYIDGEEAGTGATLSVPAKTKDYTVTVVVTDADGFKTFDEEKVTIKSSFIDMIIYFFRHLFNPAAYIVEQK